MWWVLLMLVLFPVFSQINCEIGYSNGCLIKVFKNDLKNSHASLCNDSLTPFIYGCYIDSIEKIPIKFEYGNCTNRDILFYLYKSFNSHISLKSGIPVCLSKEFSEIIDVGEGNNILGLYKQENSHIQGKNGYYNVKLKIIDKSPPNIVLFPPNNSYIVSPGIVNLHISDDKYLYKCYYLRNKYKKDLNCYLKKKIEEYIKVNYESCGKICNITVFAIDLAGNYKIKKYIYKVLVPNLEVSFIPEIGENLYLKLGRYKYKMVIRNIGTVDIKNIYFWKNGCNFINLWVNGTNVIKPYKIGNLRVGEEKYFEAYFDFLKPGRCIMYLYLNGTEAISNKPVKFIKVIKVESLIQAGPFNLLIVSENIFISIALLIVILLMLRF